MTGNLTYGGVPISDFLIVCAALVEQAGVDDLRVQVLGIGKTSAAMHLAMALRTMESARAVLLFGIAGAFPTRHRTTAAVVRPGSLCVVGSDRFGDEGTETPTGFQDLNSLKLGDCGPFPANPRMAQQAAAALGAPIVRGVTTSTCSGTEASSQRLARRSGADIETMEGAAVGFVCRQLEVPLLHIRAISNWTGDRDRGEWNLGVSVAIAQRALRRLVQGPT